MDRPEAERIQDFWTWWRTGGDELASAAESGDADRCASLLQPRVDELAPDLSWEMGPAGERLELTVTSADPARTALARRWVLAAPADPRWVFQDMKPAADTGETVLSVAGEQLPFADFRVRTARAGASVDVQVYHPGLGQLPPEAQVQAVFVALDLALGQRDVELWIGAIEPHAALPEDPITLDELREEVAALAAQAMPDGQMEWNILTADSPEGPVLVSALVRPLPILAPHLDQHLAATVPFAAHTRQGFPAPPALAALRELEDALVAELGDHGMLVAHETCAGVRTLHLYVDSALPVTEGVARVLDTWAEGGTSIELAHDPSWLAVRQYCV